MAERKKRTAAQISEEIHARNAAKRRNTKRVKQNERRRYKRGLDRWLRARNLKNLNARIDRLNSGEVRRQRLAKRAKEAKARGIKTRRKYLRRYKPRRNQLDRQHRRPIIKAKARAAECAKLTAALKQANGVIVDAFAILKKKRVKSTSYAYVYFLRKLKDHGLIPLARGLRKKHKTHFRLK